MSIELHHIGLVVKRIVDDIKIYEALGYELVSEIEIDELQNIKLAFLRRNGDKIKIELIEPIDETSSVHRTKGCYHHLCFDTHGEKNFVTKFKGMKIGKIFTKPLNAIALDNKNVVFACLKNGSFVELIL